MLVGRKNKLPADDKTLRSMGFNLIGFGALGSLYRKGQRFVVVQDGKCFEARL
jgi:hypothetical protein